MIFELLMETEADLIVLFYSKGGLNGDIINPIQSVRLHSAPAFSFLYGTVEVRMKLSRGDWLWPCNFIV